MISFGVYGDVSLAKARAKRDEARSMLAKGMNPSGKRTARTVLTGTGYSVGRVIRQGNSSLT